MSPRYSIVVAAAVACAPPSDRVEVEQDEILNAEYAGGYGVALIEKLGDRGPYCSGVTIASNLVLTAAHCLPPFVDVDVLDLTVDFNFVAVAAFPHPDWQGEADVAHDIGLLVIEDGRDSLGVMLPHETFDEIPRDVIITGGGPAEAEGRFDGYLPRQGFARVTGYDERTISLEANPAITCEGDSGGGLLAPQSGRLVVAGVHSRSTCKNTFEDVRTDAHFPSFLKPLINDHAPDSINACGTFVGRCNPDRSFFCSDGLPDPACEEGQCVADDHCDSRCFRDPDCQIRIEAPRDDAGCSTHRGRSGAWWLISLIASLLWRSRRSHRRVQSG